MSIDVSVIIPSYNETYLNKTIEDILSKATSQIEIIVNIDGAWPEPLIEDKRIIYIHPSNNKGMRWGINSAATLAKGTYLLKTDGHCMFAPNFDQVLMENHADDKWVQIPRRYSLDVEKWDINRSRPFRDYMYLSFPLDGNGNMVGLHGVEWWERQRERTGTEYDIDDTPSSQGSCWFMTKNFFDSFLHGLSEEGYGTFTQEFQEIGNKVWLGGGAVKINKKTWYAHLHKGKEHLTYRVNHEERNKINQGMIWSADYWMNNKWSERKHDISWLVEEKFPGMPSWPSNWRELYYK